MRVRPDLAKAYGCTLHNIRTMVEGCRGHMCRMFVVRLNGVQLFSHIQCHYPFANGVCVPPLMMRLELGRASNQEHEKSPDARTSIRQRTRRCPVIHSDYQTQADRYSPAIHVKRDSSAHCRPDVEQGGQITLCLLWMCLTPRPAQSSCFDPRLPGLSFGFAFAHRGCGNGVPCKVQLN